MSERTEHCPEGLLHWSAWTMPYPAFISLEIKHSFLLLRAQGKIKSTINEEITFSLPRGRRQGGRKSGNREYRNNFEEFCMKMIQKRKTDDEREN